MSYRQKIKYLLLLLLLLLLYVKPYSISNDTPYCIYPMCIFTQHLTILLITKMLYLT